LGSGRPPETGNTLLKSVGFTQKQLSVWFSNKSILDEMQALVRILKIEKWVNIYLTHGT